MKRKFISIFIALVLALSLCLVTAMPAAAAELVVGPAQYTTIQDAVDAANPAGGDTIIVEAGTWNEVVIVHTSVTLLGANEGKCAGVDPETRGDETIVSAFSILANGVTIDGFTVTGGTITNPPVAQPPTGIFANGGTSGHVITNNILMGPGVEPPGSGHGLEFGQPGVTDIIVTCNEIDGWALGAFSGGSVPPTDVLFQHNVFSNNRKGFDSSTIVNLNVINNDFTNNYGHGFGLDNYFGPSTNVAVNFNNFVGNAMGVNYGCPNSPVPGEGIDAENNWWDSASGPTHALNTYTAPAGDPQGDAVSDLVDFVPWLGALGGDPVIPVTLDLPPGQFSSIQAAIDAAGGTTITCAAGTFTENVVINTCLTLQGAGSGSDPSSNTVIASSGGDGPVIVITASGSETEHLVVKDLRVTGATGGGNTGSGILIDSNDPIGHITFDSVASVGNEGYGIAFDGYTLSDMILRKCFLSENFHGFRLPSSANDVSGIVVNDCDFDNNVQGGIMSYSVGYLDGLTVSGGSFTNNAFGIMLGAESSEPRYIKNVLVTGATFDANDKNPDYNYGFNIYVWGSTEHEVENIQVHFCSFTNHPRFGVRFSDCGFEGYDDVVIDATFNWWGDVTGPEQAITNPDGKGDKVSDRVDYIPWLTRDFQTVLTEGIGYYGYPMVELETGWNLLSTPFALDPGETIGEVTYPGCNTWAQFVTLNDLDLYTGGEPEYVSAYFFNGDVQDWAEVTSDYVLLPCDAIYVRMASPDIAAVLASPQRWMPTKTLHKDWNLVGLSSMPPGEQDAFHAKLALKSVEEVGSLTGYTQVVSPWANQPYWTYIAGMDIQDPELGWMQLTKGYWVFMENGPDVLAGFWPTPMGLP